STRREDHRGSYWPSPDGKIPVGYAYGASGIALFLLYLYLASGEERFVRVGRAALDFDLSCRVVESGLATFPELAENSTLLLPYWRAGSAGVATTMLRYMQVAGNEDLLTIFDQVLPDVCRKYTVSPGLFTGLSGLGNLLLDCHQVTGDTRYLREAHRTAEGILLYKLERPSGVAFPGDHLYRISVDYGHGSAGVGLFLHRLLHGGPNFNLLLDSLIPARVPAHV
ncbi:MAG TPA: lanthionine synthetase LanC family protein, partial [Symbiobacteriaceae bacterium]|nr:lanthionine synthetase LanC family protein [Symbiobacteriaceae bacterium]